jgi:hypothetical protein
MAAQDGARRQSFWERLQRIDRRWIYLVIWVVVMVPLIKPFPVKPVASPPVQQMFSYIDTMPEDKALIIAVDYSPDTQAELHPMTIALLRHAFATHRRVGIVATYVYGLGLGEDALRQVKREFDSVATTHEDSIISGEDFIFWGWTTPLLTMMLGMGEKITNVFPVDYYGARTESLPMTRHVKNYNDVGILVSIAGSSTPISWVAYAQTQFGLRIGCGTTAVSAADYYPYLNSGQFTGMLAGMRGAAEYEQLTREKMEQLGITWRARNRGTEAMSSQTAAHIAIILFIVVGNIGYFATRRRKS